MQKSRIIVLLVMLLTAGGILHAALTTDDIKPSSGTLKQITAAEKFLNTGSDIHAELELTALQAHAGPQQLVEKKDPFRGIFSLPQPDVYLALSGRYQIRAGNFHSAYLQYLFPYHNFW